MLKKILLLTGGVIIFLTGCLIYGITMNLNTPALSEKLAEKGLQNITNPHIVVVKDAYILQLYSDSVLVKEYRVVFGTNQRPKKTFGDKATPVGVYSVCDIDTTGPYGIMMYLNYPNMSDISASYRLGEISKEEFEKLKFEYFYKICPGASEPVVHRIGIHGIGQLNFIFKNLPFVFNWTNGSVAMSDEGMKELYSVIKRGTPVVIKETN